MGKLKSWVSFLFAFLLMGSFSEIQADNLSCLICHNSLEGTYITRDGVQTSLYVDSEKFEASVHSDLECTDCHQKYQDNPHESSEEDVDESILSIAEAIQKKSPVDPVAQAACSECHPDIYEEVQESVHGKNIFGKKETDGAFCLDCHGSPHEIIAKSDSGTASHGEGGHGDTSQVYSAVAYEHVVETCGKCHERKSISLKYGFSTQILHRYEHSFHGKKYHLGGKNLPVCTTCHGAHGIRSHKDPDAMVYGENKIALCGQCHPGANTKFVAAITHKPVGKDNPIPYYAERGLIVLLMCVIGGCALHVVFQIFAYVRDTTRTRRRMSR